MNQAAKLHWILAGLLIGTMLVPINSTMIAVGVPQLADAFKETIPNISWIITIYLIAMATCQPTAGRIGDIYGYKKVFLFGLVLFFIASVGCALSDSIFSLIVWRTMQAIGGALGTPNAIAIVRRITAQEKLSQVFGLFGFLMGFGAAIGPIIGAILIGTFGWSSIFWVNIPFLLLSFWVSYLLLPHIEPSKEQKIDGLGAIYLGVGLTLLILILTKDGFLNLATILLLIVVTALFIYQEGRFKNPLIDFQLFKNKSFTSANLSILFSNFVMYSTILFVPILFERLDYNIKIVGVFLFVFSMAMSLSSWLGGRIGNEKNKTAISIASYLFSMIAIVMYLTMEHASFVFTALSFIIGGVGSGLALPLFQTINLQSVKREQSGIASGIYSTFRYVGGMFASSFVSLFVGAELFYYVLMFTCLIGILFAAHLKAKEAEEKVCL